MSHQITKRAVKLLVRLLITSNLSFFYIPLFSQIDTAKIRQDIATVLKKHGLKDASFELRVTSSSQKGGQTAFIINNYNGRIIHVVEGNNSGINGDLTVVSDVPYAEIAKEDETGLAYHLKLPLMGGQTELSLLMKHIIEIAPDYSSFSVKVSDSSLAYTDTVIHKYPHFPFGYYAKALILFTLKNNDWFFFAKKAISIFEITTQIEGHQNVHDAALKRLNEMIARFSLPNK